MSEASHPSHSRSPAPDVPPAPARHSLPGLFWRFLRFGLLAWGGPTAQIAMIREELVDREHWVTPQRFNRVLAVYQVLPGPEAHELCCYFGMLSRGRAGSVIAGLGFMLPGLLLMLACSWLYTRFGLANPWVLAAFAGCQPAVVAILARGAIRIARHALAGADARFRVCIAIAAAAAQMVGLHFAPTLLAGAVILGCTRRRWWGAACIAAILWAGSSVAWVAVHGQEHAPLLAGHATSAPAPALAPPDHVRLLTTGLGGGLLSFGGAYTAIPVLHRDAVGAGPRPGWMTESQFLDGLAISGVLPAPMVIFGTFVGWLGGGWLGALIVTVAIFLPAFGFTLIGHGLLERVVDDQRLHAILDGVTAAVVGIMVATAAQIALATIRTPAQFVIALAAFGILMLFKSRWAIPLTVFTAAAAGSVLN